MTDKDKTDDVARKILDLPKKNRYGVEIKPCNCGKNKKDRNDKT